MPFTIVRSLPLHTVFRLQLPGDPRNGVLEIPAGVRFVLEFERTCNPTQLRISFRSAEIALQSFTVPMPGAQGDAESGGFRVDGLRLRSSDFDLRDAWGALNTETKQAELHFKVTLDPDDLPILRRFGFDAPTEIVVEDRGTIDLEERRVQLRPTMPTVPGGRLGALGLLENKSSCEVEARLYASLSPTPPTNFFWQTNSEVLICPGERAYLHYLARGNVVSARIDPGVGDVALPSDSVVVSPTSDTKYTLTATENANCVDKETAWVRVVTPGKEWTLTLPPNRETGVWTLEVPTEFASPSILVSSIKWILCLMKGDPGSGLVWDGLKIDPDGSPHSFQVTNVPSDVGDIPLAGKWSFRPRAYNYLPTNNLCMLLTVACRR